MLMKKLILALSLSGLVLQAQATVFQFDLMGLGGTGLLPGNEPSGTTGTPGTGGEVGAGIFYDDVTGMLTLNVAWGSANSFVNLTGNATAGHLHGPGTISQNAGVKYTLNTLPGWNNSASAGGFNGTISILPADQSSLLGGLLYFNAHTSVNPGGEIRGNLVVVPEPSIMALAAIGVGALLFRLRRHK